MSKYYNAPRTKNLYDPESSRPFKLSRSRLGRFMECPRCFYLDRRLGIDRPPGYPFILNSAIDTLLKKEFDIHCANGRTDVEAFDGKFEFDVTLINYVGNDSWVEPTIRDAHACLNSAIIPEADEECDYCLDREVTKEVI